MNSSLTVYDNFNNIKNAAIALQKSGYFTDVKSEAQAIVKVMAGAELGLPPFASMAGINIIQGKPALGANIIATLIKNDPRYDYRIKECNNAQCVITFFEHNQAVGDAVFTIQEAQAAGLASKDNWKKWTSDMLFARAISRGARRYAPGIFGGAPVYTPEELGADVDPEGYVDAQVIEQPQVVVHAEPAKPDNGKANEPDAAAWEAYYALVGEADALGIVVPEPEEYVTVDVLRNMYKSVKAEMLAAKIAAGK